MTRVNYIIGIVGGSITYFLGGWDVVIKVLLAFIVLDYITGVLCALMNKSLSSEIGYKGILKKVMILLIVGMSTSLNYIVEGSPIRDIVCFFFIANEGISILENTSAYLPIPQKLKDILIQLKGDEK